MFKTQTNKLKIETDEYLVRKWEKKEEDSEEKKGTEKSKKKRNGKSKL